MRTLRGFLVVSLLCAAVANARPAAAPILYAEPERTPAEPPARYFAPLPPGFDLRPGAATWLARIDWVPGPFGEIAHRVCRGDPKARERALEAVRRAAPSGFRNAWALRTVIPFCEDEADRTSMCAWGHSILDSDEPKAVRDYFYGAALCPSPPPDLGLIERSDAPAAAVLGFYRTHPGAAQSPQLEGIVGERAERGDLQELWDALEVFGAEDDQRIAALLLELRAAAIDAAHGRLFALALQHQGERHAREIYAAERERDCEEIANLRVLQRPASDPVLALAERLASFDECGPPPPRRRRISEPQPVAAAPPSPLEVALHRHGLVEVLWGLPGDGATLPEHAPAIHRMTDLVRPDLDDAIFEDVWPALDAVELDRGPQETFVAVGMDASAAHALGFRVHVPDRDGRPEREASEALAHELAAALGAPHYLDAYTKGERFRFRVGPLGRWLDVETLVGAANTLLRERGSDKRLVEVSSPEIHAIAAGPERAVRDAIASGDLPTGVASP